MGIDKHFECNTSFWNFAQWLVQGQHYVTFFTRQTRCCVHRCVQLRWNRELKKGDAIIVWVCKGARCHQHKESTLLGCPWIIYCLQQVENYKLPLMNGQATHHNFEVWNIFSGRISKCHMRWKLGCKIFCGLFNQYFIWEIDPWHVWPKSKGTNNCWTRRAHIDGVSI